MYINQLQISFFFYIFSFGFSLYLGRRKRGRPRKQFKTEELGAETEATVQEVVATRPLNVEVTPSKTDTVTQEWLNVQTPTLVSNEAEVMPNNNKDLIAQTDQTNAAEGLLELSAVGVYKFVFL